MSVSEFCDWISATPISQTLQSVTWIIPVVQSVHILAIAVVGVLAHGDKLSTLTRRYLPWIWAALLVLLISGLTLVVGEPKRELLNPVFWTKMGLLVCVVLITLTIQRPLRKDELFWDSDPRRTLAIAMAWLALAFWVGIFFCGRWIAYTYEP